MMHDHCDCGKHCARRPVDVIAEVEASMGRMIAQRPKRAIDAIEKARRERAR